MIYKLDNKDIAFCGKTFSECFVIAFTNMPNVDQIKKIKEELDEVQEEVLKLKYDDNSSVERLIEECFDLKQAVDTLIFNNIRIQEYQYYLKKHIEKMMNKFNLSKKDEDEYRLAIKYVAKDVIDKACEKMIEKLRESGVYHG